MVKSTFSLGGKLLTIFLTLVIFIGAIAGTIVVVYKTVKVRTLAGLFGGENWISESYDDTIEGFIGKVSQALGGEITLNTLREISPALGDKMDALVDNVENVGLFVLDRDALYSTPLNAITGDLMNILVITASLNDLSEKMSFTLPDLDIITGSEQEPLQIYTNVVKDGAVDKAFSMSETPYTYYTRAEIFCDTYTETETDPETGAVTETEKPVMTFETRNVYELSDIAVASNNITYGGAKLYLGRESVSSDDEGNQSSSVTYAAITKNSSALYELDETQDTARFALADGEKLYVKTVATQQNPSGYADVTPQTPADTAVRPAVAAKYRYAPLYAQLDAQPAEGTEFIASDGKYYVPANQKDGDGYAVDAASGGFVILDEYRGQKLFRLDYVYTEADPAQTDAQTPLYVCTDGVGDLPVTYGITALSSFLDTSTMTLDSMGEYFGISMDTAMLESIKYVPLRYISSSMTAEVNNLYIDDVITVDASSPAILRYLAGYTLNEDGTLDTSGRRTLGEIDAVLDGVTVGSVVEIKDDSHPLLQSISDWSMNDVGNSDKINSLTLGNVLTIVTDEEATQQGSTASPKILQMLADTPLGEIGSAIDSLAIKDITDVSDSNILSNLANSTLSTLATDLKNLTVEQMFADDVYGKHVVGTAADYASLVQTYGAQNLFAYINGEYVQYDAEEHAGKDVFASHIAVGGDGQYANVPLYVYDADSNAYVSATETSSWKLSDKDKELLEGTDLYLRTDTAEGDPVYAPVTGETFGADTLYYWDAASETMRAVSLVPASLRVKAEYAGQTLYSRLVYAGTYAEGTAYSHGNLFYYDTAKECWIQVKLVSSADGAGTVTYTAEEGQPIAKGTALYTYGKIKGVWRYLLTENGAETSCNIQQINTLVSNVRENMNALTVSELHEDGMVRIDDPDLVLGAEIPENLQPQFGGATKLGQLKLNDLLKLAAILLSAK